MKKNNIKKTRIGIVVSDKMNKTVIVKVEKFKKHALYHKRFKISKNFQSHDKDNVYMVGDKVKIMETRPISKNKHFKVIELITKGKRV